MPTLEPEDRPLSDVDRIGVVIQQTEFGYHSGFIYKLNEEARILHLAFHYILKDEIAESPYRWANMGLDDLNKDILLEILQRISKTSPLIPYGFNSEGICFDENTGEMLPAPLGRGLTCSTFICAVLRGFGYELVDATSWPNRDEDVAHFEKLIEFLKEYADPEHVEQVQKDVNSKRLRPEEIAGAATLPSDTWPVSFTEARLLADEIVRDLAVA